METITTYSNFPDIYIYKIVNDLYAFHYITEVIRPLRYTLQDINAITKTALIDKVPIIIELELIIGDTDEKLKTEIRI